MGNSQSQGLECNSDCQSYDNRSTDDTSYQQDLKRKNERLACR